MATRAFGKQRVLAVQLHAGLVIGLAAAVAGDPHVAGRHALHRSVFAEQHLGGGETGENLNPKCLCLSRQPAGKTAERNGVAALVVHERRHREMRKPELALLGQHPRSEEHTSELQSLMRTSYAVSCL